MSLYTSLVSLTSITSGGSVVKAVAEANSENDTKKLYYIKKILTLTALGIGLLIGLFVFVLSEELSFLAFKSAKYIFELQIMGFVIIFAIFSNFWQSWLNGLRLVKKIAKIRVYTSILVSQLSILFIYLYGLNGVIYSIIVIPLIGFIFSGWFFFKSRLPIKVSINYTDNSALFHNIFKVGLVLLLISLLFQVGVYVNRTIITNKMGIDSLGVFFAAWMISMSYLEIFLSSLSVDYYPRLVENKANPKAYNQIVNEQLFFSLSLVFPLVIFVYVYAPFIISSLFSNDFLGAVNILRWQIIGDLFKVFVWIFGYLLIVHSHLKYSLFVQFIWVSGYTLFLWFGLNSLGLEVAGIAFLVSYFISFLFLYLYVNKYLILNFQTIIKNCSILF